MALSSSRVILKIRQQVDVVQKRFRGKINITKPKKLHYARAVMDQFVTPFYEATRPPTPIWELCENANKKNKALEAPHPYDQIIARECLNWYNNSRMIAFFHMNPTKARDELDMRIQIRKSNMYLKYYGKSIYKLALKNSRFEAVIPLFSAPGRIIFSAEPNVPALMKILKQNPHMILMAGILDGVLLSIKDFMKYGTMNLDQERAKLVQTIQTAAGANLCRQLNHHPSTLVSRLEAIANKDKDN
ncbi:hypothetical protein G9C98_002756 [Cotesia typhae]|uniref:39S ribosomal protein L10, mitochondrial n=1 Tax=Cotesia typhae TaxID=2053667 RepID=A0A8J5VC42_9HYME|nr:hypothetical protein G9C98_002756 [Cotesia typhae]